MPLPLLFDSRGLFVNPRGVLMYLYKPSSYNPEVIGEEICFRGSLDRANASINSFFLKGKYGGYMWKESFYNDYTWSLHKPLEPSFKKLTKVEVL